MVLVHSNKDGLFVISPLSLLQFRVKVVDKPFSALLALATGQVGGDLGPFPSVELSLLS